MISYILKHVRLFCIASLIIGSSPVWAKEETKKSPFDEVPYTPFENTFSTCPEYGEGYYRTSLGGTCFRLGGSVAAETRFRSSSSKHYKTRSSKQALQGTVRVEAITQTELGPLKMTIEATKELERHSGPDYTR